ncbi:hypothetical protein [Geminisphaera colitermitum]|uniref:hypothetical protein n=1 Tax=Geminisphaera colitermitum TaxID=1148786 RepID=UPI000158CA8D|nr:hypothetical protein [Geminisphaera colitermitum]
MSLITTSQRNDLRTALLSELTAARTVALPAEALTRRVIRSKVLDFEPSAEDANKEIDALFRRGLITSIPDPVTGVLHYQATAAGVAACP